MEREEQREIWRKDENDRRRESKGMRKEERETEEKLWDREMER